MQLLLCPVCDETPEMAESGGVSYPYCPSCRYMTHEIGLTSTEEECRAWNRIAAKAEDRRRRLRLLKVGDKVESTEHGRGVVIEFDIAHRLPVLVEFDYHFERYDEEGRKDYTGPVVLVKL